MTTGLILPYLHFTTISPVNVAGALNQPIGFCSSNIDVKWDGVTYQGNVGSSPTTNESSVGLSVDTMEFTVLKSNFGTKLPFTDFNVANGLFDNARVSVHIEDLLYLPPSRSHTSANLLFSGFVGRVQILPTCYVFEFRTQSTKLNQPTVDKTSPYCKWQFGDSNCGYNLAAQGEALLNNVITSTIQATSTAGIFSIAVQNTPTGLGIAGRYKGGTIIFKNGRNNGFRRQIVDYVPVGQLFRFRRLPPFGVVVGDTVDVLANCEKTQSACKFRQNFDNFGGFPSGGKYMTGLDTILLSGNRAGQPRD